MKINTLFSTYLCTILNLYYMCEIALYDLYNQLSTILWNNFCSPIFFFPESHGLRILSYLVRLSYTVHQFFKQDNQLFFLMQINCIHNGINMSCAWVLNNCKILLIDLKKLASVDGILKEQTNYIIEINKFLLSCKKYQTAF